MAAVFGVAEFAATTRSSKSAAEATSRALSLYRKFQKSVLALLPASRSFNPWMLTGYTIGARNPATVRARHSCWRFASKDSPRVRKAPSCTGPRRAWRLACKGTHGIPRDHERLEADDTHLPLLYRRRSSTKANHLLGQILRRQILDCYYLQ